MLFNFKLISKETNSKEKINTLNKYNKYINKIPIIDIPNIQIINIIKELDKNKVKKLLKEETLSLLILSIKKEILLLKNNLLLSSIKLLNKIPIIKQIIVEIPSTNNNLFFLNNLIILNYINNIKKYNKYYKFIV